jgi:hypothetical protein
MNPQEVTEELEHPGARTLLDSATLLRLAYNGSDGFPRVIPIGFYWNGNRIVVCTAATAPKVKALSSRQNVAMTIDVGDTPTEAKALLVRGLASVDIVDGVPDEYVAASRKALGARIAVLDRAHHRLRRLGARLTQGHSGQRRRRQRRPRLPARPRRTGLRDPGVPWGRFCFFSAPNGNGWSVHEPPRPS